MLRIWAFIAKHGPYVLLFTLLLFFKKPTQMADVRHSRFLHS